MCVCVCVCGSVCIVAFAFEFSCCEWLSVYTTHTPTYTHMHTRKVSQDTLFLRTFYGTPLYASPELCQNKPYNEKTDIWSLGVVLYEMAALTPPFNAESIMGLAEAITKVNRRQQLIARCAIDRQL